jgi:hypothetical protein
VRERPNRAVSKTDLALSAKPKQTSIKPAPGIANLGLDRTSQFPWISLLSPSISQRFSQHVFFGWDTGIARVAVAAAPAGIYEDSHTRSDIAESIGTKTNHSEKNRLTFLMTARTRKSTLNPPPAHASPAEKRGRREAQPSGLVVTSGDVSTAIPTPLDLFPRNALAAEGDQNVRSRGMTI